MPYLIPFTQYSLPYGIRGETQFITQHEEIYNKAMLILDENYVFEVEVLTTGQVSATIVDVELEEDVAFAITDNVENMVRTEVEKMILEFDPYRSDEE